MTSSEPDLADLGTWITDNDSCLFRSDDFIHFEEQFLLEGGEIADVLTEAPLQTGGASEEEGSETENVVPPKPGVPNLGKLMT